MKYDDILIPTLVGMGILTRNTVEEFMITNGINPSRDTVLEKMVEIGLVSEESIAHAVARMCNTEFLRIKKERVSTDALRLIDKSPIAHFLRCVPFRIFGTKVWVAISEVPSETHMEHIQSLFEGYKLVFVAITRSEMNILLKRHYFNTRSITTSTSEKCLKPAMAN